jgi:hypothetical protein
VIFSQPYHPEFGDSDVQSTADHENLSGQVGTLAMASCCLPDLDCQDWGSSQLTPSKTSMHRHSSSPSSTQVTESWGSCSRDASPPPRTTSS